MATKTKIILAEETELFRKSLITLLHTDPRLDVIAEASNGRELIERLKQLKPDIVIFDTDMPVMDGKTALDIICKRFPEVKTIILSKHSDRQHQADFMRHGANSYLCKSCEVQTLFRAIEKVKSDGYFFENSTSIALLDSILKEKEPGKDSNIISFNDRETEILKKICDGTTNKEIANFLHLSASTIDFYRTKIYKKVKCNNVAGLIKFALKNGLIPTS